MIHKYIVFGYAPEVGRHISAYSKTGSGEGLMAGKKEKAKTVKKRESKAEHKTKKTQGTGKSSPPVLKKPSAVRKTKARALYIAGIGEPEHCRTAITDISERKEAEDALLRISERHRSYIDITGHLCWTTNAEGEVVEDIPSWRRYTGQTYEEIKGWGWAKALHPDDLELTTQAWKKAVTTKTSYEVEYRIRRHDGAYRFFLVRGVPVYTEGGGIREWVGTCIDITERKQTEEFLRNSREDLRRAQEVGNIGNWRLDVRQNILTWSDETYRIFGIPAGTPLTYESFLSVVHPYDREYVDAEWKAGLKGEPYDIEHRIVVDGQIKWVREKAYLEFDRQGELLGGFGITQDITKLKLAEERLIESQRFSRQVMESTPNIVFIFDIADNYLVYANHQLGLVLGYTLEEVRTMGGEIYQQLLHPEDMSKASIHLKQIASAGNNDTVSVQLRVRHAEGEWRWIQIRNIVFKTAEDGSVKQILGTAEDITGRKMIENELDKYREELEELVTERTSELVLTNEELEREISGREKAYALLKENERKFRKLSQEFNTLLDAIPYSIMLLSPDLQVLWANRGASEMIGRKQHEIADAFCYELWHDAKTPCDECPSVVSFNTGEPVSAQRSANGRFWEVKSFPLKDDDGKVSNVMVFTTDITEKLSLQAEAMRAGHLASLGELAAGVAHEINNPINGIINYAQILADRSRDSSHEKDIAKQIIEEGERIASIVKSLLFFAHDRKEDKTPVNVHQILSDSLALTSAQMRKDGIQLTVDFPYDLPEIIAHPQQIEQVFLNVINNARYSLNQKYTGPDRNKALKVYGEKIIADQQEYVRTVFHDSGLGIPVDIINKVMNPFFTTKPAGKGTGLGLSISHGIISDHEGRIKVESVEGKFASIIIDLPVKGYDER